MIDGYHNNTMVALHPKRCILSTLSNQVPRCSGLVYSRCTLFSTQSEASVVRCSTNPTWQQNGESRNLTNDFLKVIIHLQVVFYMSATVYLDMIVFNTLI